MSVVVVVAADLGRVIGRDNHLPWHLPADLKRFKALTMGRAVVMGRRTHASIGRPLPGRLNIVISRDVGFTAAGCETSSSLAAALQRGAAHHPEVMIIGGASVYAEALPLADRLLLTVVHARFVGDAFFPPLAPGTWSIAGKEELVDPQLSATFYDLHRRAAGDSDDDAFVWPVGVDPAPSAS